MSEMTPVTELGDVALLDEYANIERWAGDEFAVASIPQDQLKRGYDARLEILRRMKARGTAEGYVVVPREPTRAMLDAAWADALGEDAAGVWSSMVASALNEKETAMKR